ncbi:hypothetical protein RRG08_048013 [Elysia crispata]|uniref:Uncharacterized protein n=1 Tax=Elysia crispata TaxID=231223 RepID=A0AAE0XRS1_9GAST|nr:hypothetical protein RRG08_048013 [Elysia crispata]
MAEIRARAYHPPSMIQSGEFGEPRKPFCGRTCSRIENLSMIAASGPKSPFGYVYFGHCIAFCLVLPDISTISSSDFSKFKSQLETVRFKRETPPSKSELFNLITAAWFCLQLNWRNSKKLMRSGI